MQVKNTPLEAFEDIKDYPFQPNWMDIGDNLQVHYVDEGAKNDPVVLLLHGEPSWSYLYRKMIPIFVNAGFRTIAPDLIGFGKSSKPAEQSNYSYANHINWMATWLNQLGISNINLFCQDWGGLIGLRLLAEQPEKFSSLVVANTGLPTGDFEMPESFIKWQQYVQKVEILPIGQILQNNTVRVLTDDEINAYDAPFPDETYKAGARIFPLLVPTSSNDPEAINNKKAWKQLMEWQKPTLTLFSDNDPITRGGEVPFQKLMPGAKRQNHLTIKSAGHFLQEDSGVEIAKVMLDFIITTMSEIRH